MALELGTADADKIELRMTPPFDVSGRIAYEDERALEASKIVDRDAAPGWPQRLLLGDELLPKALWAQIGGDDSFKLEKVQPGRYHVSAFFGHTYAKSVSLGSKDSGDGTLDLRNGPGSDVVTVTVSANWCEIDGTVSDANGPVSGATVIVNGNIFMPADSNGHYLVKSLRPGTYRAIRSRKI